MLASLALRSAAAPARFLPSLSLAGKTALLTGAAGGIGQSIARGYIEAGVNKLAIFDYNREAACKSAADLVREYEHEKKLVPSGTLAIEGYGVDVGNEDEVAAAVEAAAAQLGQIDILLHSAGVIENYPAEDYPREKWRRLRQTDVDGAWFMATQTARQVLSNGHPASFILIASMSATIVNYPQKQAPYCFSKAAVKHMGAALGVEWGKTGIRVNTISPGYVLSALSRSVLENAPNGHEMYEDWVGKTPLGRLGEPVCPASGPDLCDLLCDRSPIDN